ncbi:Pentatricopeptide repeat-containing protein [Apostasia shenzhenica]|uniref:Pentatricopeptide repeat-containing protein n=1 Tax=Apostasia shenzhenica TaxID=1088818 RepID=A0A2I0BF40_9ASPA|nr:Pentatricopeptide repeat-containing protein [Apostasia shenzhenica]
MSQPLLRSLQKSCCHLLTNGSKPAPGAAAKAMEALCREGDVFLARKLFDEMPQKNVFYFSAMIYGYSSNGFFNESLSLFSQMDEMPEPGLAEWNAMIAGFLRCYQLEEALHLFERLRKSGIKANHITMTSVSQICVSHGSSILCEGIHGFILKLGFDADVSLMNSVLKMYLSFRRKDPAKGFFRKMKTKDVISWTMMMELPILNSLISMYSKCGVPEVARFLFDRIAHRNVVSWTAMMFGYSCNRKPREGVGLLIRMRREESFHPDSVTLICAILCSSELFNLSLCKQLHACSLTSGLMLYQEVRNNLVAAYGKCGYADFARRVFEEMIHRNLISWNVMISSYGINGECQKAVSLFQEMEENGGEPDTITYVNVLNACSHSGMVDDGLRVFEKMLKERRIEPKGEHWGCVVDMLGRSGRLEDAKKLADLMMKKEGSNSWKALLGGSHINDDSGVAEFAAERVSEVDAGHFVLLSNLYASAGKFDHVESVRARIGAKGLVKNRGFSLVDTLPGN